MNNPTEDQIWDNTDRSSGCWEWTGVKHVDGYGLIWLNGKLIRSHRKAYELAIGPIPPGMLIDHICHNRACINTSHLRSATVKQNAENRRLANKGNASGVRGVTWRKDLGKWEARVIHNGKSIRCGYFPDIPGAEAKVIAKRNELFTHNDLDRRAA